MPTVQVAPLPPGALLGHYANGTGYTDCYSVRVDRAVTLVAFIEAFYTSPLFKLERALLSVNPGFRSTDAEAMELAQGTRRQFAAWTVEARAPNQILLAAGRTRSWLMVGAPGSVAAASDALYFGSAIVPRQRGGLGWQYAALVGFHKLYSRLLLAAAARRLARSGR